MERRNFITRLYDILANLEMKLGGKRILNNCNGYMSWPRRGVYFFFERGETRTHSGKGLRIVRVGTHALKRKAKTKFWGRLKQHQGNILGTHPGGGNHRGSVFREHLGFAIINKKKKVCPSWGESPVDQDDRDLEYEIEREVSNHIRAMPFLWVEVNDEPSPDSMRHFIEMNSIALLSNFNRNQIDPPSESWLGKYSRNDKVRKSGLWNDNHVERDPDLGFLDILDKFVMEA